mgnify:CR=1 FL=1
MIGGEARSLVGKGSTFATVIAGAPATSLAESGTSALPRLGALLGTLPVVGLRDGAVLIVRVGLSVLRPVVLPELLGVVVIFSGGRDEGVAETNGRRGAGADGGNKGSDSELHIYYNVLL